MELCSYVFWLWNILIEIYAKEKYDRVRTIIDAPSNFTGNRINGSQSAP